MLERVIRGRDGENGSEEREGKRRGLRGKKKWRE